MPTIKISTLTSTTTSEKNNNLLVILLYIYISLLGLAFLGFILENLKKKNNNNVILRNRNIKNNNLNNFDTFNNIGKIIYIKNKESYDDCTICLEKLNYKNNNIIFKLDCGHSFHINCWKKWNYSTPKPTCPLCRFTIYN